MNLHLENVTVSFAKGLFTPSAPKGAATTVAKYNCHLLLTSGYRMFEYKGAGNFMPITPEAVITAVAQEAWKAQAATLLRTLERTRVCIRDGDTMLTKEGDIRSGYAGIKYLSLKNNNPPEVLNRDKTPILESDNLMTSGCVVNAIISIIATPPGGNRSIYGLIKKLQYVRKGKDLGESGIGDFKMLPPAGDLEVDMSSL